MVGISIWSVGVFHDYKKFGLDFSVAGAYFLGFLSSSLIVGFLIALFLSIPINNGYITTYSYDLVAMKDNFNSKGVFFLGSGMANEELKYFYYYKSGNGFRSSSVPADNVEIIEDNSTPRIEEKWGSYEDSAWTINTSSGYSWFEGAIIHIPKRSITTEFKLDLQ